MSIQPHVLWPLPNSFTSSLFSSSHALKVLKLFISVINQLDARHFCFTISLFHASIIRRSKLHYTASGIIAPIGGHLVHETATYRCDDTRGCVMQIWPPDDEHMCSKHVEVWNKLIVKQKFCASSWLISEINILKCSQQNIKKVLKLV